MFKIIINILNIYNAESIIKLYISGSVSKSGMLFLASSISGLKSYLKRYPFSCGSENIRVTVRKIYVVEENPYASLLVQFSTVFPPRELHIQCHAPNKHFRLPYLMVLLSFYCPTSAGLLWCNFDTLTPVPYQYIFFFNHNFDPGIFNIIL